MSTQYRLSYHDVASSVINTNKLLRKQNGFEHSDSGGNFVNAKLCESIAFAGSKENALSL